MTDLAEPTAVDLFDPDAFVDGPPHEYLTHLRATQPVFRQAMAEGDDAWVVLRHADLVHVAREPILFSASLGGVVIEDLDPEALAMMRHMLLAMDPPPHADYRAPLSPHFGARVIGGLEERIRTICRRIMAEAAERGDVEFVHDVCGALPSQVVGEIMGLPEEDWGRIQRWAERQTSGQDPELAAVGEDEDENAMVAMAMYFIEFGARRRTEPIREDLTSLILATEFGRDDRAPEPMNDIDFGSFCVQLVTAGNDTTKTMLSSGLQALLQHPEQLDALRADPSLIPGAVEEILRWANPLHYFRRTASADTELAGVPIAEGEKVAMYYTSANRDEAVFDDPFEFRIDRDPNPHLGFGVGEHYCLGAALAKMEIRVFLEHFARRVSDVEAVGPRVNTHAGFVGGIKHLPIRWDSV